MAVEVASLHRVASPRGVASVHEVEVKEQFMLETSMALVACINCLLFIKKWYETVFL